MRLVKHLPGDEQLIHDESADVVERASAFSRLASDGVRSIRPVAVEWLAHEDPLLRGEAIGKLITYWEEDADVEAGLLMLAGDPAWDVRSSAAYSLGSYLFRSEALENREPKHKRRILAALIRQLETDPDDFVQAACYEALVRALVPGGASPTLSDPFDREREVDWDLLAPWREQPPGEPEPA
jgi:HEAT repeat protein